MTGKGAAAAVVYGYARQKTLHGPSPFPPVIFPEHCLSRRGPAPHDRGPENDASWRDSRDADAKVRALMYRPLITCLWRGRPRKPILEVRTACLALSFALPKF